jgi:nucleoside-diphosphate-sugar epimerase
MKVIITGATGFIGREIVSELQSKEFEVYALGNSNVNSSQSDLRFFKVDITNFEEVATLKQIGETDSIVHSAGLAHQFGNIEREKFQKTNVEGTKNILNLAASLKANHFVLISSTAIYETKKKINGELEIIYENSPCLPKTFYAESKLEAEHLAIKFCEQNNIRLTIFRLAPVIGEQNAGNVARLIETIDKKRFVWIGSGKNYKSLIYKKDVAKACRVILLHKKNGIEIFNIAAQPILMRDFVKQIAKLLGKKIPKFYIPPKILEGFFRLNKKSLRLGKISKISDTVEKWLSDDVYSAEKFEREYAFRPETSIFEALEKQIAWYKKQKTDSGAV